MNKNNWKIAFLFLLVINLVIVIAILSMLFVPSAQHVSPPALANKDQVSFYVKSNKNDLTLLINHYLKQEATAGSPIDYQIALTNEVELYGTLPVFSDLLNLKMTFVPQALSNGDLVLKQKSISIGDLNLPVSYVLKMISDSYKLPSGVIIQPNQKLIYINMQQLKTKSNVKVKVDKFDLKHDDIAFTLFVPVK